MFLVLGKRNGNNCQGVSFPNYINGFKFLSTNYTRTQIIEKVFLVKSLQKEIKQVVLLLEETITKGVCSISK